MKDWSWIKSVPVFHLNDIARRTKSQGYARLAAHRLVKEGLVKRITRNAYTSSDDIFAIASNMHHPSYISFLSASYRHGFTETIPQRVYVASATRHRTIEFDAYVIELVPFRHIWGYHKEGEGPHLAFIADPEKLMIDAFIKPACMGNFSEIENVSGMQGLRMRANSGNTWGDAALNGYSARWAGWPGITSESTSPE